MNINDSAEHLIFKIGELCGSNAAQALEYARLKTTDLIATGNCRESKQSRRMEVRGVSDRAPKKIFKTAPSGMAIDASNASLIPIVLLGKR